MTNVNLWVEMRSCKHVEAFGDKLYLFFPRNMEDNYISQVGQIFYNGGEVVLIVQVGEVSDASLVTHYNHFRS